MTSGIAEAVELAKCRQHASNYYKAKVSKIYNRLSLVQDKIKKTMITYNLWKQTIPQLDPLVDKIINIRYQLGLDYISGGFYELSAFLKENDIEFKKEKTCEEITKTTFEMQWNDHRYRLIHADEYSWQALHQIKIIKHPIIEEFSDPTPFDRIFIFFLHCLFDPEYDKNRNPRVPYFKHNGEKLDWPKGDHGQFMECKSEYNPFLN